jgi:endonuclease-3
LAATKSPVKKTATPRQARRAATPEKISRAAKPRQMTRAAVRSFMEAIAAANPEPETELDYSTPFTLLVAVVLSAQATDVSVNRVTQTLFAEAPDPEAMVRLGVDGVAKHIRSIGLWQAKARNVVELSRLLTLRHGGTVPPAREALEALPGVGRKTANVVLNVAFGESTMAVDTHIFRLGNRTGIAPGTTTRAVEDGLVKRIPPEMLRHAHHWLILHGRYVCKARKPECWRCVAEKWCLYRDKTPMPSVDGGKPEG